MPDSGVTLLRLNRPDRLNALSMELRLELGMQISRATADDTVRCVVITGDAKAFAAGADVDELLLRTPKHPILRAHGHYGHPSSNAQSPSSRR